jgi:hypothetical protein
MIEETESKPIIIDNPEILRFFENTMFEPQKFILKLINIYKLQRSEEDQYKNLGRTIYHFEDIDPIIREIQTCEQQKELLLKLAHDMTITANKIKFPEASQFYQKIYGKPKQPNLFICDVCKIATFAKPRALETHKRTCIHKTREEPSREPIETPLIVPPPEKQTKQLTHHLIARPITKAATSTTTPPP